MSSTHTSAIRKFIAVRAVQTGLLDPARLFTHTFPLDRLGDALEIAAARPAGFMKALVLMQ